MSFINQIIYASKMVYMHIFPSLYLKYKRQMYINRLQTVAKSCFFKAEIPEGASFDDYQNALVKHLVSVNEYLYNYEFWNKSEVTRSEFISQYSTYMVYNWFRIYFPTYHNWKLFDYKELALSRLTEVGLIKRRWLYTPHATNEQISELLHSTDCIVKPHNATHGEGVYKVKHDDEQAIAAVLKQVKSSPAVIEECVTGCDELQQFHPGSLNTLRVVTIAYEGQGEVFGACFRMGRGDSVIDNSHGGGIVATINVDTGCIEGDAYGDNGRYFHEHPDTGIVINGFQIPQWDKIKQTCIDAANAIRGSIIVGWDLTLTADGNVEFIEANNTPDFDGGMQAPLKKGVKRQLTDTIYRVTGKRYHG